MPPVERPHFAFPFERDPATGKVRVVEQDTPEHVMACENVIVRCPRGFRLDRPEFGWRFPQFRNVPVDVTELEAALQQFEPRSRARGSEYADAANAARRRISVEVSADG
jgi:phage baseplate assembly protein W